MKTTKGLKALDKLKRDAEATYDMDLCWDNIAANQAATDEYMDKLRAQMAAVPGAEYLYMSLIEGSITAGSTAEHNNAIEQLEVMLTDSYHANILLHTYDSVRAITT